jgi:GDP-4-dehydro-6-deoxy-D-mannose reductase
MRRDPGAGWSTALALERWHAVVGWDQTPFSGKKVLVTGSNGFVGRYLVPLLRGLGAVVVGVGLQEIDTSGCQEYYCANLEMRDATRQLVQKVSTDFAIHLAAQSSVGSSWADEWRTISANVGSSVNLLNALSRTEPTRVLLISSGEVYGHIARPAQVEDTLAPCNPYAMSKALVEMTVRSYDESELQIVTARAFNHTGLGRPSSFFEAYVIHELAVAARAGVAKILLRTGNVDVIRDYSDVRDVVVQYLLLLDTGNAGGVYNVCSGRGWLLRDVIALVGEIAQIDVGVDVDPARLRPNDVAYLVGSSSLPEFGPRIPLETTLKEMYDAELDSLGATRTAAREWG